MNRMDQAGYWQYRATLIDWASLPEGQRGPAPRKPGEARPVLTRPTSTQPAIPAWLERFSLKRLALFALKMALFAGLAHLLAGCGGAASDTDPIADATADAAAVVATPDAGVPASTSQKRVIPLCEGSPAESPELCQDLRYGDHGYCNAWVACR